MNSVTKRRFLQLNTLKRVGIIVIFSLFSTPLAFSQEVENSNIYHHRITASGQEVSNTNAVITIEVNKIFIAPESHRKGIISSHLYGSNWASWRKFSGPIKKKAELLNLRLIRLGGSQMSRYNWRTGKLTFPGKERVESQPTNVDNFVKSCRELGAEPFIQINAMGWAPNDKNNDTFEKCITAEDSADLIIYLNKTKGYKVKYFEIDNEPFIWDGIHSDIWDYEISVEEYTEIFKEYAYKMKRAQDQITSADDIKIFGPAISILTSWKHDVFSNVIYFLKECKKFENDKTNNPEEYRILDVLSFHYYPLFRTDWRNPRSFIPEGVPAMLESVQTWYNPSYINRYDYNLSKGEPAYIIPRFNKYIEKYYPGTELAVTELGVDSANNIKYEPMVEPIYMADLWGIMAKYGVDYAMPHWVAHSDPCFGLISYTKNRPIYYPFMLYSQHFDGTILVADSNKSDLLNVYACRDEEKNIVLMVVNKDKNDYHTAVNLVGYKGTAVKNKFFYTFKKYSLTCIKISQDTKIKTVDVWVYTVKLTH